MSVNRRVLNQANTTATSISGDWLLRWDATTRAGIGYLTSEAVNDVDSWEAQDGGLGTYTFAAVSVVSLFPEYILDSDGLPCIHFQDDGGMYQVNMLSANAALHARLDDATDVTVFLVAKLLDPANESAGNAYCYQGVNGFRVGTVGLDTSLDLWETGTSTSAANVFDNRRFIASFTNLHNGVDDNDCTTYVGKTQVNATTAQTDVAAAGINTLTIGSFNNAATASWDTDCNIYELLIYGRTLSTGEREAVVDYLSAKWQVTNADNASDTITTSTNATWETNYIDSEGVALTGKDVVGGYRVRPLIATDTPRLSGTKSLFTDDNFPFSLTPDQWFRSDQKVTVVAGDVTQWDSIIGSASMTSGTDNDPAFEANLDGFPAITFDSTNTEGLTSDTTVTTAGESGFVVLRLPAVPITANNRQCLATIHTNIVFFGNSDDSIFKNSLIAYSNRTSFPDFQHSYRDDRERIVVCSWRYDDSAPSGLFEVWFDGHKTENRTVDTVSGSPAPMLGQANHTVYNSGSVYEYCAYETLLSDANMLLLQRYACNRYNIPLMPDVTPRMVGARDGGTTSALPENDTVFWYRADFAGGLADPARDRLITSWSMKPEVTEHSIALTNTSSTSQILWDKSDRRALDVIAADAQPLDAASSYTWSESTVFPPETGCSGMFLGTITADSDSSGYIWQAGLTNFLVRRTGAASTLTVRAGDATVTATVNDYLGSSVLVIGTYDFTETTARVWVYSEATSEMLTLAGGTITTLGAVTPEFGAWTTFDADGDMLEAAAWKHQLTTDARESLVRYVEHRYNLNFAAI